MKVPTRLLLVPTLGALAACSLAFRGEDFFSETKTPGPSVDAGPLDAPADGVATQDAAIDSPVPMPVPDADAGCPNGGSFCDNFEGDSGLMWMPSASSNAAMVRSTASAPKTAG